MASIYHPPDHAYNADDLIDFLTESCEQLLSTLPNTKLIIAGDLNKLNICSLLNQLSLFQMVKTPTRGANILDVFISNIPHYWKKVKVVKSLVRSDHKMIIVYPRETVKAKRTNFYFRDVRQHRKLNMWTELNDVDWNEIENEKQPLNEMVEKFYTTIWPKFEKCFPLIKVRTSTRDPPFISPLVKHLLKQRKRTIKTRDSEANTRLQTQINNLIRRNQLNAVRNENRKCKSGTKDWWSNINKITGRNNNKMPISSYIDPNEINNFFHDINTDPHYTAPELEEIPEGTRVPMLTVEMVFNFLQNLKCTSTGPDDLPYWFWKEYGVELAPTITKIFNSSLKMSKVPKFWKKADLTPVPKEDTLESCNQLRPISLTDIIMRIFEKCVYKAEIAHLIGEIIDTDQFAYKKCHNTIMALIKCQHSSLKWLENGARYVRVFSFDFKKAFDSVPHDILCSKLRNLPLNPYIYNWIVNFLDGRYQRVKVDGIRTNYVSINRGVPQGTVLGPVLFSVMINDIKTVNNQNELVKFADDLTLEVPGFDHGDTSLIEVKNIEEWSERNRMQLNMKKTYEMVIRSKISITLPPAIPNIKRKSSLKILGMNLENIPDKWDVHFDEMISKAAGRMYILRVCKYYGMPINQLNLLFNSLIIPLFTYGIELWGGTYSKYINQIEKFISRAYRNGYIAQKLNFNEVISDRDRKLWKKIINNKNNALQDLLPSKLNRPLRQRGHEFELPMIRTERFKRSFINRCLYKFV